MKNKIHPISLLLAVALGIVGCGDPIAAGGPGPGVPPAVPAPVPTAPVEVDAGVEEPEEPGMPSMPDEAFAEVDVQNRDPFRDYGDFFRQTAGDERVERRANVKMADVAIEDMRLIAVVTGSAAPMAMVQGPGGDGVVVRRGDFIGQDQLVETGGSESLPVRLNWRVSRIRASEVVLTREDPTAPNRPPLTRALPLYAEGEEFVGNILAVDPSLVSGSQMSGEQGDMVNLGGGNTIRIETTTAQVPAASSMAPASATPMGGRQGMPVPATMAP